jgi:hypothetical protein
LLNIISGTLSVGVTPSTSSYESIATVTVGSGGSSYVEFTSIANTWTHLQIRTISRDTTGNNQSYGIRFNSDTGANYSWHRLYGYGTGVGAGGAANANQMYAGYYSNASNNFGANIVDILDYANTNKYKTLRSIGGFNDNSEGRIFYNSGSWRSTNAITTIRITPDSWDFAQYSHFALYGIRG